MDSKIAEFLTKLVLEDDEDDVVCFAFPNEKRRIKCSISMLTELSPVFEAMFSTRWRQDESGDDQMVSDKTIKLDDDGVTFNQYQIFKIFMQILYGLRQIDSLSVDQATGVYFYSHKYQIKDVEDKIHKYLNERMHSGMSKLPLSITDLKEGIEFAQMYELDEFKNKLDLVKLAFDETNPIQFWELVNKFEMETLKQQVVDHLKTIVPKEDWTPDILHAVITCLQTERAGLKKTLEEVKCGCTRAYTLYCSTCGNTGRAVSTILPNL